MTRKISNLLLLTLSLGLTLLAVELYFRFFVLLPDSFNQTLVTRSWRRRYWKPVNSLGYRDREHPMSGTIGKKIVLVAGDSFAAGHGIEDPGKRFPDTLQALIGGAWEVINLSKEGWETADEYEALSIYPVSPNVIILSYYVNDVTKAAVQTGFPPPRVIDDPPRFLQLLIGRSYLFNFLYWRFYRWSHAFIGEDYWDYLKRCYRNPLIWKNHRDELLKIIDFARTKQARLVFLIFPHLRYLEESEPITRQIETLARDNGIETINLSDQFRGKRYQDLMVNRQDSHPNENAHRQAGRLLAGLFAEPPIAKPLNGKRML